MAASDTIVRHEDRGLGHRRVSVDDLLRAPAARGGTSRDGGAGVRQLLLSLTERLPRKEDVGEPVEGRRSGLVGDGGGEGLGGHFDPFLHPILGASVESDRFRLSTHT